MSWFTIYVLTPHFISYSPLISLVTGLVAEEPSFFSEAGGTPMASIVLASLTYIPFIQTSSNSHSLTQLLWLRVRVTHIPSYKIPSSGSG
jgi:hypothetical protein